MTDLIIGIASYENPNGLRATIDNLLRNTVGDYEIYVVDNNSQNSEVKRVLGGYIDDPRIKVDYRSDNVGYVGAVNQILKYAQDAGVHYVAYSDNDCSVLTLSWNRMFIDVLESNHLVAMCFANGGAFPINRGNYNEILWGVGCFWMLNVPRIAEIGYFDTTIGHQEEVDYQQRLHLGGWKVASVPQVQISHSQTASTNPAAQERINNGVINWVNKWNKYYHGPHINYFSENVTRFEDWTALYMEEWFKLQPELQGLNTNPETIYIQALGREVDLIRVPRWQHLYRGRII